MRHLLFTLLLTTSALVGCLGATDGGPSPAEIATGQRAEADDLADSGSSSPGPASTAGAGGTSKAQAAAAPPGEGRCEEPAHGLDHPCVADGLSFGERVHWEGGDLPDWRSGGHGTDYLSTARVHLHPDDERLQLTPGDALGTRTCKQTNDCLEHSFQVAETAPGARLRVDAQVFFEDDDHVRIRADNGAQGHETGLVLQLFPPSARGDPEAEPADVASTIGSFAASLFAGGYDPETGEPLEPIETGTWTLQVSGLLPGVMEHRLRAGLEAPDPPSEVLAFPDLKIIPPFEVGFMVPTASFHPGVPTDVATPGATCMAEEYEEAIEENREPPTTCLRFSMGFYNAGDGALRLREAPNEDLAKEVGHTAGTEDVPLVQGVCTPTGHRCTDVPDLDLHSRWHTSHTHYHYQNVYVFDLLRVVPGTEDRARPTLEQVSSSGKLGMNPGNEAMEGWERFYQLPRPAPDGTDADGNGISWAIKLQAGWGDIYEWNRGGNYVDFPLTETGQPVPGEYVLRGTTDPDGELRETDETNNHGYAHIRVSGLGAVELIERGFGADPWAGDKHIAEVTP